MSAPPSPSVPAIKPETGFKVRGLRWYIVFMLCLASELNYLDRQTLSVLAKTIQDELHISTMQYANITTTFLICYMVAYAISGRLVDWLGTRKSFMIFVTGWSVANALHAFARTPVQFMVYRGLLGATEPANFPAGVRAAAEWFPMRERALAVGIFNAGTALGAAIAAPLVAWIALTWHWRYAFVFGGVLGLIWVVVWAIVYRLPRDHPWLRAEELALIESDRPANTEPAPPPPTVPIRRILSRKEAWGCIVARILTDPISYFFIFWTPLFLQQERGFNLADIGKYSWIPFVGLTVGNICAGGIPALLMRRGWSLNRARKTVMFGAGCLMPICCLTVTQVPSAAMAVALITLAMFAHAAWGNVILPAEVFPPHVIGAVTGFGGALGSLVGALSQQAIGWTAQNIGFWPIFAVGSVVHLTGFALVCLLIGELGKVREI
jgi:ACS family hexuronate transporter-like MFS transporter